MSDGNVRKKRKWLILDNIVLLKYCRIEEVKKLPTFY
jgi:hypothetical protein